MALALAACTEEERKQAMARFAVLRPHLNEGVLLAEAARDAGVPLRSVQRWLARYRAAGLVGLVRAKRSDMGKRKLPAELVALVEGMALRTPRPSMGTIQISGQHVQREESRIEGHNGADNRTRIIDDASECMEHEKEHGYDE